MCGSKQKTNVVHNMWFQPTTLIQLLIIMKNKSWSITSVVLVVLKEFVSSVHTDQNISIINPPWAILVWYSVRQISNPKTITPGPACGPFWSGSLPSAQTQTQLPCIQRSNHVTYENLAWVCISFWYPGSGWKKTRLGKTKMIVRKSNDQWVRQAVLLFAQTRDSMGWNWT
jgi:hypothetical protein